MLCEGFMAEIITVTNQKGGVGKTTACSALCGGIVARDKSVLAVDLDPQGNLSFSLGGETDGRLTVYDVLKGEADLRDAIQHTSVCDVLPANIMLSALELELTGSDREFILSDKLNKVKNDYDYIIIDTPPALSVLTINAYTAADSLIIPMMPEILSLQGISQLKETIFAVKKYYNSKLTVKGILLNKYNPRLTLTKEVEELAELIAAQLETKLFKNKLSASIAFAEAPAHGETIIDYSPKSKSAAQSRAFADEVLGIVEEPVKRKPRSFKRVVRHSPT